MRFWTVQPSEVWETLQRDGVCLVEPKRLLCVPEAYTWLVGQLKRRLPGYEGRLPWWLYCERPDLRWVRWSRPQGEIEVRLELELPAERVHTMLIKDWHKVYGGGWVFRRRHREMCWWDLLERRGDPLPVHWQALLERSWERVFDARRLEGWARCKMEAVTEKLLLDDVVRCDPFTGMCKWNIRAKLARSQRLERERTAVNEGETLAFDTLSSVLSEGTGCAEASGEQG